MMLEMALTDKIIGVDISQENITNAQTILYSLGNMKELHPDL